MIGLLLACLAHAADWAAREPLRVSERGLQPLALDDAALVERGRAHGWPLVTGGEEAPFRVVSRVLATYEAEIGRIDGRAADVRWQVVEAATDTVVYEVTTRGWVPARGEADPLQVAFDNLLARDALAAVLAPPPEAEGPDLLHIAACRTAPVALPEWLPILAPAIVQVRQGGTTGRGALISPDGFVLTGVPVDAGASATVTLTSGMTLEAEVVRTDTSGVALLWLPGSGFPCVRPAGAFQVGMPVFTAGEGGTLVRGTLLGTPVLDGLTLVQTDTVAGAGGPLLDGQAGMIAATTAHGFAVPLALARARLQIAWGERTTASPEPAPRIPIVALDEDDPPIVALEARICLFRPGRGDAVDLVVGTRPVSLEGGHYTCVMLPSGTHSVGLAGGIAPPAVTLEAGETSYFRVLGKLGVEADSERAFERARARGLAEDL